MDRIQQSNTGDSRRDRATSSNLNPWDGHRIPKVSEDFLLKKPRDFIRSAWDSTPRRPQRVNMQIDTFNEHLGKITGDYSDICYSKILLQEQKDQYIDQVKIISEEFERYSHEAIKDYGNIIPRLSRDKRENAFTELERLNNVIQEMYKDWNKTKQIELDINEILSKQTYLLPKHRKTIKRLINQTVNDIRAYYHRALDNYNNASLQLEIPHLESHDLVPVVRDSVRGEAWEELNKPIKLLRKYISMEQEIASLKQWFQDYTSRPAAREHSELQILLSHAQHVQERIDGFFKYRQLKDLDSALEDYNQAHFNIENAGIRFFIAAHDGQLSDSVASLKYHADRAYQGVMGTPKQKDAYPLYQGAYHAMAEFIKTHSPQGSVDGSKSYQAEQKAVELITALYRMIPGMEQT